MDSEREAEHYRYIRDGTLRGSEIVVIAESNLTSDPAERAQRRLRLLPTFQGAPADRGRYVASRKVGKQMPELTGKIRFVTIIANTRHNGKETMSETPDVRQHCECVID